MIALVALLCISQSDWAATTPSTQSTKPARDPLSDLPAYGDAVKRMVYTLLAIVAGLIVVAKFLPRLLGQRGRIGSGKLINIIEAHRIEPRKTLYLVRVGEQYFLLGSTADRIEVLSGSPLDHERVAELLKAQEIAASPAGASTPPKRTFADVLRGKKPTGKSV